MLLPKLHSRYKFIILRRYLLILKLLYLIAGVSAVIQCCAEHIWILHNRHLQARTHGDNATSNSPQQSLLWCSLGHVTRQAETATDAKGKLEATHQDGGRGVPWWAMHLEEPRPKSIPYRDAQLRDWNTNSALYLHVAIEKHSDNWRKIVKSLGVFLVPDTLLIHLSPVNLYLHACRCVF
jgi:hypothetical protein